MSCDRYELRFRLLYRPLFLGSLYAKPALELQIETSNEKDTQQYERSEQHYIRYRIR